uniref:Uncharacterized protein n=1 Tax=Nelumbo nucifera TaxID=4432 RepID=A0A822ZHW5_NELNU|nr:TPA_asm: hypothetical protein HUJ06_001199 [Nelumbo nucifera]
MKILNTRRERESCNNLVKAETLEWKMVVMNDSLKAAKERDVKYSDGLVSTDHSSDSERGRCRP